MRIHAISGGGILAEEGDDGSWLSVQQTTRRGSSTPMVNHSSNMLKEPRVWAVANVEDVWIWPSRQLAPAFGNDRTYASSRDCVKYSIDQLLRLVNDNTAEADVYRGGPGLQKFYQFGRRGIFRWLLEEESTHVYGNQPSGQRSSR